MKKSKLLILLDIPLFLLNYVYLIICARLLIKDDFGLLNSYLATLSIAFVIGVSLQVKAANSSKPFVSKKNILFFSLLTGLLPLIIAFIFSFSMVHTLLILSVCFLHPFSSLTRGLFIKNQKYLSYYASLYIELVPKLLMVILFLWLSIKKFEYVIFSLIVGQALATVYGLIFTKVNFIKNKKNSLKMIFQAKEIMINQLAFFLIIGIDIFLVNKYFTSQAGEISLAIRFSQVPLLVFFTFLQFDIQKISKLKSMGQVAKAYAPVILGLFVPTYLGLQMLGTFIVNLFFGEEYATSLTYTPFYLVYFSIIAIAYAYSFMKSLQGKFKESLIMITFSILLLPLYHYFQDQFIGAQTYQAYLGLVLLFSFILYHFFSHSSKPTTLSSPHHLE